MSRLTIVLALVAGLAATACDFGYGHVGFYNDCEEWANVVPGDQFPTGGPLYFLLHEAGEPTVHLAPTRVGGVAAATRPKGSAILDGYITVWLKDNAGKFVGPLDAFPNEQVKLVDGQFRRSWCARPADDVLPCQLGHGDDDVCEGTPPLGGGGGGDDGFGGGFGTVDEPERCTWSQERFEWVCP